jgi:Lon protease-like protein
MHDTTTKHTHLRDEGLNKKLCQRLKALVMGLKNKFEHMNKFEQDRSKKPWVEKETLVYDLTSYVVEKPV